MWIYYGNCGIKADQNFVIPHNSAAAAPAGKSTVAQSTDPTNHRNECAAKCPYTDANCIGFGPYKPAQIVTEIEGLGKWKIYVHDE